MIRKEKFANGLTLLTESMPHVRSVSIGVWLRQGSRHEKPAINGISHFIEHLVFKGTETRSARDIALAMESFGGQMDAFTSKEYTCFYAKVLDQHLGEVVELLADIVRRPRFDPVELERERKVVLEEIRMVEDTPDELVYDLFSKNFYPNHSLGRPIQGTAETIGGMSRRKLLNFFKAAYRPASMLIVAAGNLNHKKLAGKVREQFSAAPLDGRKPPKVSPPRVNGGIFTRSKKLEQLHLLMGIPVFADRIEQRYPLFVLNALLGGTMSSRLFQEIREERGLAYSVYSGVNAFMDSGFLMVCAATRPSGGNEVIGLTLEQLVDLKQNGPEPSEVAVAKEHLKGSLMLSLEATSSRMSNLARQEMYFGRQYSLKQILAGIEKVSRDDVHDMVKQRLSLGRIGLAALGRTGQFRLRKEALTV